MEPVSSDRLTEGNLRALGQGVDKLFGVSDPDTPLLLRDRMEEDSRCNHDAEVHARGIQTRRRRAREGASR